MTTVARLSIETQIWSLVGNLKKGRVGHSVIRSDKTEIILYYFIMIGNNKEAAVDENRVGL